ncbi:MAG: YqzL family protein [Armatimonadetes bacterium]|nr:YqzL family protein [Armatimonadota bacterium]
MAPDFFWGVFQNTGSVAAYLLYKQRDPSTS